MRHASGRQKNVLNGFALDMHVRFADGEGVNIVGLKVTKAVIDETVSSFVRADSIENIFHRRVLWKTPIIFGNRGGVHLLPVPTI
jgi:hypothetical protein